MLMRAGRKKWWNGNYQQIYCFIMIASWALHFDQAQDKTRSVGELTNIHESAGVNDKN
jgi:hypothetical protein